MAQSLEMTNILLLGAGRTAFYLVKYLLNTCEEHNWHLTVGDFNVQNIDDIVENHERLSKIKFDINDSALAKQEIGHATAVISLLPAQFHIEVGRTCLELGKHFFSASYVSDDFKELKSEIAQKGLLFLKETGLDPGLDHMSAMRVLDHIRAKGGEIKKFYSYTGGLMSPSHQDNPWEYKFTWNPMFVVTAGRDGGMYLRDGRIKRIPYHRLFKEIDELQMPGYGVFDAYYNRNSLKYINEYHLDDVKTVVRYTLRRQGFCEAWHPLVSLGLTDNIHEFDFDKPITNRQFLNLFIRIGDGTLEERVSRVINQPQYSEVFRKLKWLGLFDDVEIPLMKGTSAAFLREILMPKWEMESSEKDMIYMAHVCYYTLDGKTFKHKSYLAVEGINRSETAMAKTVGLPLAIAAKQKLLGNIELSGLHIPTVPELYHPILNELADLGVEFAEIEEEIE